MSQHVEPAALSWDGPTPYADQFGDLYYSADDPLGEIQHTFLDGVGFQDLVQKPHLAIAETGFGTGLNFLSAWAAWENAVQRGNTLTFVSVEAFPISREDLTRAHAPFPALAAYAAALQAQWPGATPGIHRLQFSGGRVRLILIIGEAASSFAQMRFQADAWFLDGFAPAKNPEMWRDAVLSQIARLSKPGAPLATFTAAGAVRRGLEAVGFTMSKRPGFGRKRDCLAGSLDRPPSGPAHHWADPVPRSNPGTVAIVGDGIAAHCAHQALQGAGHTVIRVGGGKSSTYAASTLPRALIAPKLVRGDQPFPVFWRQAYLDAVRFIDTIAPDSWVGPRGLSIPATQKTDTAWQALLCEELGWPNEDISPEDGELLLSRAGSIDPKTLLAALACPADIQKDVTTLERGGEAWLLRSETGKTLVEADTIVLANGPGAVPLLPEPQDGFGLRVGSGHLRMMQATSTPPDTAVLRNGYRTSADADGVFAVGASVTPRQPLAPVTVDPIKDADLAERTTPLFGDAVVQSTWTGLRCDTVDHLPILGAVQDPAGFAQHYQPLRHGSNPDQSDDTLAYHQGLYAFSGLGARGFQGAFLLADTLAALFSGSPIALSETVTKALAPNRFQARALIRNTS